MKCDEMRHLTGVSSCSCFAPRFYLFLIKMKTHVEAWSHLELRLRIGWRVRQRFLLWARLDADGVSVNGKGLVPRSMEGVSLRHSYLMLSV